MKSIILRGLNALRANKYRALVALVGLFLVASNAYLLVRERSVPVFIRSEAEVADEGKTKEAGNLEFFKEAPLGPVSTDSMTYNLVHANCLNKLRYQTQPSSTFKSSPYDGSFMVGSNSTSPGALHGLYDINGDNLPDYVYFRSYTGEGSVDITSTYEACVYLHNGTGWSKAYTCLAQTQINKETGAVMDAKYYGDCGQF